MSQPLSQYRGRHNRKGSKARRRGVGPPPRTSPCAHTVAYPALVQSADAGDAVKMLTGISVRANPKLR